MNHNAPDIHDSTHDDAQRLERRLVQEDRDRNRVRTDDLTDQEARALVDDACEDGRVHVIPEDCVYVLTATGQTFREPEPLAVALQTVTALTQSND